EALTGGRIGQPVSRESFLFWVPTQCILRKATRPDALARPGSVPGLFFLCWVGAGLIFFHLRATSRTGAMAPLNSRTIRGAPPLSTLDFLRVGRSYARFSLAP